MDKKLESTHARRDFLKQVSLAGAVFGISAAGTFLASEFLPLKDSGLVSRKEVDDAATLICINLTNVRRLFAENGLFEIFETNPYLLVTKDYISASNVLNKYQCRLRLDEEGQHELLKSYATCLNGRDSFLISHSVRNLSEKHELNTDVMYFDEKFLLKTATLKKIAQLCQNLLSIDDPRLTSNLEHTSKLLERALKEEKLDRYEQASLVTLYCRLRSLSNGQIE